MSIRHFLTLYSAGPFLWAPAEVFLQADAARHLDLPLLRAAMLLVAAGHVAPFVPLATRRVLESRSPVLCALKVAHPTIKRLLIRMLYVVNFQKLLRSSEMM